MKDGGEGGGGTTDVRGVAVERAVLRTKCV